MPYTKEGRKPAHEAILDRIEKYLSVFSSFGVRTFERERGERELRSLFSLLDSIIIPAEHLEVVRQRLTEMRASVKMLKEEVERIFGDLDRFAPPPPDPNQHPEHDDRDREGLTHRNESEMD